MDRKQFFEKFADAIEIEEASQLYMDTEFRSLDEWSSLAYLSVIAMLDEEYGLKVENLAIKKMRTIGDIINYVETNLKVS